MKDYFYVVLLVYHGVLFLGLYIAELVYTCSFQRFSSQNYVSLMEHFCTVRNIIISPSFFTLHVYKCHNYILYN